MFGEAPWVQPTTATQWSRDEDKLFEQALVMVPEGLPDRWRLIGEKLGKSATEVEEHYKALEHDVWEIESGRVDMPQYLDDMKWEGQISFESKKHGGGDADRKKGTPWSEHEHKLFLIGLTKFGKGDWRSISRNVVVTRTPTQVASHAQKYFLRQSSVKKERKRTSIHDITIVDGTLEPADQNNLITSPATPVQQAPTLGHMPDQRGQMWYQNFGFPPM